MSPSDPRLLTLVAATMLAIAVLAAVVPARRANAVDPIVVLREE